MGGAHACPSLGQIAVVLPFISICKNRDTTDQICSGWPCCGGARKLPTSPLSLGLASPEVRQKYFPGLPPWLWGQRSSMFAAPAGRTGMCCRWGWLVLWISNVFPWLVGFWVVWSEVFSAERRTKSLLEQKQRSPTLMVYIESALCWEFVLEVVLPGAVPYMQILLQIVWEI